MTYWLATSLWFLVAYLVLNTFMGVYNFASNKNKTEYPGLAAFLYVIIMLPILAVPIWAAVFVGTL